MPGRETSGTDDAIHYAIAVEIGEIANELASVCWRVIKRPSWSCADEGSNVELDEAVILVTLSYKGDARVLVQTKKNSYDRGL